MKHFGAIDGTKILIASYIGRLETDKNARKSVTRRRLHGTHRLGLVGSTERKYNDLQPAAIWGMSEQMNYDEFVKLLEERGDTVFIVDKGLVRFGKFALATLAIFGVVGVFFFGLDIKKAAEEAKEARFETQKTLLELGDATKLLGLAKNELNQSKEDLVTFIRNAKTELQKSLSEAIESSKRTKTIEQEVMGVRVRLGLPRFRLGLPDIQSEDEFNAGNLVEDDIGHAIDILNKKFPKPAEVKVVERRQNLAKVEINGLRGTILSGHNYIGNG